MACRYLLRSAAARLAKSSAAADLGFAVQTVGCFDTLAALVDRLQIAD